jgi:hypothetical protein
VPDGLETARHSAQQLIQEVRRQLTTLNPTSAGTARPLDSALGGIRRNLAAEVGGAFSDYLIGRRRPGQQVARLLVDQGRETRRRQALSLARSGALWLLNQLESTVQQGLLEPIDSRFQRHLTLGIRRASYAARPQTILRKVEGLAQEILAYSPPDDDISVVRRLDVRLRELLRARLSAIDRSWWVARVPSPVRVRAERAMRTRRPDSRAPWQFLSFSDYGRVVLTDANWTEAFSAVFGDRVVFQRNFAKLTLLRNDVAHSRPLTAPDRLEFRRIANHLLSMIG